MGAFVWLVVLGTSIWVYLDAKKIGVKKGQLDGFCDLGPGAWAVVCLLLWIIGFPAYLIKRGEYIKINRGDSEETTVSEADIQVKTSAEPKAGTKPAGIESNENQRPRRESSPSGQPSSRALLKKGIGLFKSGNYKEALSVFDQVISLNAKYAEAYFIRGAIYNRLGKKDLAIVDLKSAANLGHKKSQDLLVAKGVAI
jgi:tetratricopeptide (TPR) repeat protein